jgi:hypothetical protein
LFLLAPPRDANTTTNPRGENISLGYAQKRDLLRGDSSFCLVLLVVQKPNSIPEGKIIKPTKYFTTSEVLAP